MPDLNFGLGLGPDEVEALLLSLRVAFVATLASLPLAVGVAWVLARRSFPGKALLNGAVHLPLVLPPVVTGYVLLLLLGRNGPIGAFLDQTLGVVVAFRWTGAVVASAVMGFPLAVRAIRLSLENVDRGLEAAAGSLGAPPFWVFLTVTLPLITPGLLVGAILCFAKSLGEFGATITFAGSVAGRTQTLPLAVFFDLGFDPDRAIALSVVLVFISILILVSLRERWLTPLR